MRKGLLLLAAVLVWAPALADYTNYEVGHVHPLALTPSGDRLLVVNTPDAMLDVFTVEGNGDLTYLQSISVGIEPVSVAVLDENTAWVANNLSDTVSIVDLALGTAVDTIDVGNEPTSIVFAAGKAFVAISEEDAVKVFDVADPTAPPQVIDLMADDIRALAVSADGTKVYGVPHHSGNQTTVINATLADKNDDQLNAGRRDALGLNSMECSSPPPGMPGLPAGMTRNPALPGPSSPTLSVIVKFDRASGQWLDADGQDWSACLPIDLVDHDLFIIDVATLAVSTVDHLGTTIFDVSVNPANGKVYLSNTEALNDVRFEHVLGLEGHVIDHQLSIVDPATSAATIVELNAHIDRTSTPPSNLPERLASISEPGMMVWKSDGSVGYLTAIGTRKVFRVDGACTAPACIFGADRSAPDAVETGGGPTGVALAEAVDRLYVLNRFDNTVSIIDTQSFSKLSDVALHDPSDPAVKNGRQFLYDAIISSRHGDGACSSCHPSGDTDRISWNLGNPEGEHDPYSSTFDNVRFVSAGRTRPRGCDLNEDPGCADHSGFDPQKGAMFTLTLRGMLEPLHWRGDRATLLEFNQTFPALLGTEDIGPINGQPAGISDADMQTFREFILNVHMPPNPYRGVRDTIPDADVHFPERNFTGNPTAGLDKFQNMIVRGNARCSSCHQLTHGAAGGNLFGQEPEEPTNRRSAALHRGGPVEFGSDHSDLKVAHLRALNEKLGPIFGDGVNPPPPSKSGFGYGHDGSIPSLKHWLSWAQFKLNAGDGARDVRDIASFLMHFPTQTPPATGRQVTVPAGTPPTGSEAEEQLIQDLRAVGNLADSRRLRHCDLVASALQGGRERKWHFKDFWVGDVRDDPLLTTTQLREFVDGPITFTCAPTDNGQRLGGDRDEDRRRDGDDCAPLDPAFGRSCP